MIGLREMYTSKTATANKVLPKSGLKCFDWAFVQDSRLVILLNFVLKIPAFGKPRNVSGNFAKPNETQ